MKEYNKTTVLLTCFLLFQSFLIVSVPLVNANSEIPNKFHQNLDLNKEYIYKVSSFNSEMSLYWADLDYMAPGKGYAATNEGGEIRFMLTGFYDKDPNDFFNLFESPMPYMDVKFYQNVDGTLELNSTFANVSNGEAAQNLLLGYNKFKSGFLIPTDDFTELTESAKAQDEPPFMNATVTVTETSNRITFDFEQKGGFMQKTLVTYDKKSGLLTYTNTTVGAYNLIMELTNGPGATIPAFPFLPFASTLSIVCIATLIYVFISEKKRLISK
ncbi:MAG: conserved exported protein of unknown function [Promethearchaeota archaeon]|nr:MAG: conserved exported protein of unknown function [Candidatus Lokiarchaeota archaeon]